MFKFKEMRNKVCICSFMFLILSLFLVSAAPPVTQVQQFTEGYVIKYPSEQSIKQNQFYDFEFHVFNISTGMPITSGVSCQFHLYNVTGGHQLTLYDDAVSTLFDYSFKVHGGNFSQTGDFYYIIQCNSSSRGGYVEVPFDVTPMGIANITNYYYLLIILSLGVIVIGYLFKDSWIVILGSMGLYFLGLQIMIYGIEGIKNTSTTWAIGLVTIFAAAYFSIRAGYELMEGG